MGTCLQELILMVVKTSVDERLLVFCSVDLETLASVGNVGQLYTLSSISLRIMTAGILWGCNTWSVASSCVLLDSLGNSLMVVIFSNLTFGSLCK